MTPAPMPADEDERLAALRELLLLDTPPEERFDRLARFAAEQLDTPIALLTLVDGQRQWFKSRVGIEATETPREISFCGHAILQDQALVIPDAWLDPRFTDNPLVTGEPHIRFYAGQPLAGPDQHRHAHVDLADGPLHDVPVVWADDTRRRRRHRPGLPATAGRP